MLHDPGKFEVLSSLNYRELDFQKYLPLLNDMKVPIHIRREMMHGGNITFEIPKQNTFSYIPLSVHQN